MTALHRTLVRRALAPLLAAISLAALGPGPTAFASDLYTSGWTGFDISFPQCQDVTIPDKVGIGAPYAFAILGVNHGRAFTRNDCLADEYQYAAAQGLSIGYVMNLNSPRGTIGPNGQASGSGCTADTPACQNYNYGWNAAQDAYQYTLQTLQSLGVADTPTTWWMDIEVTNYWSPDPSLNAQVIQGAIDFFQQEVEGATIGVYSVRSMWQTIVGGDYRPGVPEWLAGARSLAGASSLCGQSSFTGGPITLVQYATRSLDVDYAC